MLSVGGLPLGQRQAHTYVCIHNKISITALSHMSLKDVA